MLVTDYPRPGLEPRSAPLKLGLLATTQRRRREGNSSHESRSHEVNFKEHFFFFFFLIRFALEIHIVHFKTVYGSVAEAATKPDGIAVLGIMVEPSYEDNHKFENIIEALKQIEEAGESEHGGIT